MSQNWILYTDGACRGNPGESGAGAFIEGPQGEISLRRYLGRKTNNQAEYLALILGLEKIRDLGVKSVEIRADSELMIKQLRGEYRVKNEGILPLFKQAQQLVKDIKVHFKHVPREQNKVADILANEAIDFNDVV